LHPPLKRENGACVGTVGTDGRFLELRATSAGGSLHLVLTGWPGSSPTPREGMLGNASFVEQGGH
jgi:hypothetical protein